jgi:hypothetical protein
MNLQEATDIVDESFDTGNGDEAGNALRVLIDHARSLPPVERVVDPFQDGETTLVALAAETPTDGPVYVFEDRPGEVMWPGGGTSDFDEAEGYAKAYLAVVAEARRRGLDGGQDQ